MDCQRSKSRSSAELIADNDDLLLETILLRLPPKPAVRFQLVCKHWQSLISAPSFSIRHTRRRRPKPQPSFIFLKTPRKYFYFSPIGNVFDKLSLNSLYTKILQSCNGLLLLECSHSEYGRRHYLVCNPTTKQSRELDMGTDRLIAWVCLAFDPAISIYYKIICVCKPHYSVKVYDSESEEWTSFGTPFPSNINSLLMNPIHRNNKMYWIRPTSKSFFFDLQTGKVEDVPQIKTRQRKRVEINNKNYIMGSNGHIHCISIYLGPNLKSLLVFELLGDNSGWFELYRVNLNPIAVELPEMNGQVTVLGIVRGETELETFVFLHFPGKVVRYRFCDGSFEVVVDLTRSEIYHERQLQFLHYHTFAFIESLAPV